MTGQEAMEMMKMLCTTEAQRTYYQKYLQIKQKFNENQISKAQAVRQTIQAENKLNRTEVSTPRQAKKLAKTARKSKIEQQKINSHLRKALYCDLQAEALEAQNKWMLDMMACAESRNIGTAPLPNPSFVKRCPDILSVLNDPNSTFRTKCRNS